MSWHRGRLAAFDIETTGVDPERDRIVTAAVSLVGDDRESQHLSWLVDPGIEIPAGATAVHGITTAHARAEGRSACEAVEEITAALAEKLLEGVPVIAFNARFDLTILDREAQRHALRRLVERVGGTEGMLVIDPHVLDKHFDRFRRGKRTLGAVCEHYSVRLEQAHAANADALAAARVAFRLATRVPELAAMSLPDLHREQVVWAAEQAASLEDYFREQGREERIERVWPVVPAGLPRAA
ncbi:MAG: exonuclease domain-containing protein [Solirubrobacteraceae bacterium]